MTHPAIIGLAVFMMLAQRKYEIVTHSLIGDHEKLTRDSSHPNRTVTRV